jgi:NDP-sugar pyrophosphorylase family protein
MSVRTTRNQTIGIVLAGAHPWTNSAFDQLLPRSLLPIAHRPLISYALSWLHEGGIQEVAVCANRETRALQAILLRHVPRGMTLSYHQDPMPRGAAGALCDAAAASDGDIFVVADGTAIPNVDLQDLLLVHHSSGAAVTLVVHSEPGRNENHCLEVPNGIYVFSRRALDVVPDRGFYDIKENLIPQLYRSGERIITYSTAHASPRVLDVSSYLAVNEWMVEQIVTTGEHPDGYVKSGTCLFHGDAMIADDAVFIGPVLVGAGVRVMSGAVIVGPTSIGREATLGRGVLVSRSAIWRRSFLGDQAVLDRCVLADDAIVDAHKQAFKAIMGADLSFGAEMGRDVTMEPREAPSFEFLRKVGRVLSGEAWSRSPAAQ